MRTEVTKPFNWGFFLTEQELRRVVQTCHEHILKQLSADVCRVLFWAKLGDGSIIESNKVDDIVTLENAGSKQIRRLTIIFDDGKEESDWQILVRFQDAYNNPTSWTSVEFEVVGQSRDWAFLAASDIEERLRKIKTLSSIYIFQNRWATTVPLIAGAGLYFLILSLLPPENSAVAQLESAYRSGTVKDTIEAIILLEKAKEAHNPYVRTFVILALSFVLPVAVSWSLGKIIPMISPSYNFYWGDYMAYYNKRKNAKNIFWTVIVLGIIVSLASAYILRLLP